MKFMIWLMLLLVASMANPNPGLVIDVKRQIFLDVINRYFEEVLETYGHVEIESMELEGILLTAIDAYIVNDSPDNVQFDFSEEHNALEAGVANTKLDMTFNWKYNSLLSGKARVSGPVSKAALGVGFSSAQKDAFTIPSVNLNYFDFALDRAAFKLDFQCKLCPQFLVDLLVKIFKGSLLDNVENSVKATFDEEFATDLNQALYDFYPTTISATEDIGVCTALINGIQVKSDHLELPLDLTFFLLEDGYQRQGDGPIVPAYDPAVPAEIMVSLSSYVTTSIQNILNKTPLSFPFKALFINMSLNVLGPQYPTTITMKKNNLSVKASPELVIAWFRTKYSVEFEAKLDFSVKNGDDTNLIYVTPKLNSVSLKKFSVTFLGIKLNLIVFRVLLNWLVKIVANFILIPTFAVPQLPGLPLQTTNSILNVNDDYMFFGLSVAFGYVMNQMFG